nr:MAG TPA: chemokine [Caudoviricetes sp.]
MVQIHRCPLIMGMVSDVVAPIKTTRHTFVLDVWFA